VYGHEIVKVLNTFSDIMQRRNFWTLISADLDSPQNSKEFYAVNISRLIKNR
jgi:hypothetical protein